MRALWITLFGMTLSVVHLAEELPTDEALSCSSGECEMEDMSALQRDARQHQREDQPGTVADKLNDKLSEKQQQHSDRVPRKQSGFQVPDEGEESALGLLILTYAYPTQPGDIDDKRSFCTVDSNYMCTDGFSIVKAEVHGLLFTVAQNAEWNDDLNVSFTNAVRALVTNPRVRAITANCGFMTNYEDKVTEIMTTLHLTEGTPMLPFLMGSLALGPVFTSQTGENGGLEGWGILEENNRALVVTANSMTLGPRFFSIMDQAGIQEAGLKALLGSRNPSGDKLKQLQSRMSEKFGSEDTALSAADILAHLTTWLEMRGNSRAASIMKNRGQYFRTYGAQDVIGFGEAVALGTAHNASLASPNMVTWVLDTLFRIEFFQPKRRKADVQATFVLMECTELPAYSNSVRMSARVPVWDITTVAQCLMASASSYNPSEHITQNGAFKACMLSWTDPYKFEPRFGKQVDRSIVGYNDTLGTGPARSLEDFDWGLLGKPTGDRCTKDIGCYGATH